MLTSIRLVFLKKNTTVSNFVAQWRTFSSFSVVQTCRQCVLKDSDGSVFGKYPYVWLRDNCQCDRCFHPSSHNRLSRMAKLNPEISPRRSEIDNVNQELHIEWPDSHQSKFPLSWLRDTHFSTSPKDPLIQPKQILWSAKMMQDRVPTFAYKDIQQSDTCLHDWIDSLQVYGLALIKEAPKRLGIVKEIGKRIGFLRRTGVGETFQVDGKPNDEASNVAYTDFELGLHTDLTYYNNSSTIQMLHCIRQIRGKGGENQFCDGFKVADDIKRKDPELFDVLSTTLIDYRDCREVIAGPQNLKSRRLTIKLNLDGSYDSVCFNDLTRAPHQNIPAKDVFQVYRSLKLFNNETNKSENKIEFKINEGEIITFNNERVLHGRSAFVATSDNRRHYEGCYLDWDEACSRKNVIREKMVN